MADPEVLTNVHTNAPSASFPQKVLSCPLPQSLLPHPRGFSYPQSVVMAVLEFSVYGITQYELCVWFLSSNMMFF